MVYFKKAAWRGRKEALRRFWALQAKHAELARRRRWINNQRFQKMRGGCRKCRYNKSGGYR